MVLSYSEKDTRKLFARITGHDNYGELDVVDNDPEDLVSRMADIYDGICGGKKPCRPVEHVLSMEEVASLFGVRGMGPLMLDRLLSFGTPEEMRRLLSDGTEDPVLCRIGDRADKRAEEADRRMIAPSGNRQGRRVPAPPRVSSEESQGLQRLERLVDVSVGYYRPRESQPVQRLHGVGVVRRHEPAGLSGVSEVAYQT